MAGKSAEWVFEDPRLKAMHQDYDAYTEENFAVWKTLYERQIVNLPNAASKAYLEGIKEINFTADRIANFSEVNQILSKSTGWGVQVVPGLIDDDLFFGLLNHKRFPSSTWLRKMEQLDYLEEPDMFHDAFAHMPMLTNQPYVDFLQDLSGIALKYIDDKWAIHLLSRIYWFTIEFGLIRENGALKIYGAGILSSAGETKFSLSDDPEHRDYDVRSIMQTPYWKDKFQDKYYVIESYEQLYNSIPEIERVLAEELIANEDPEKEP
ncbi:phenylalanine 4-monooxygenase [Echinicola vietnamensis]|uniref:Phenylalanine-4-hydroxylase n=1 Tax=Echinicola vietnamensis (strain DSM 17526 / LMG 23754 / KMM 6221) TaxID=926556 RepID=L0FXW8_ECHVK|nr:phenylalanine 4-monooxygenase [Echinicola vietnamensis]AGA78759.1 phenylalanine-4-hydroxylase [Echinicola vietnamensis DSM 17526]